MISPDTISQVRERTDIVAIVSESVPSLKKRGRSFVGLCPFHQEKSASFHVNAERGFFHCFGCKESGSAIDFLMKADGYTFPEAVRVLAERAGVEIREDRGDRTDADRHRREREDLYSVSQAAASYFETELRSHPLASFAVDELARRGIAIKDDVVQAFRIGYAPHGWDGLANFLRSQGFSPVTAEAVGLLVPRSSGTGHYDRFRHRLMFTILDTQGRVVAFSGRALPDPPSAERRPEPPAKYVNSPESPIYSKGEQLFGLFQARHAIRADEQAIVVEGNFDVVSLHAKGVNTAVAPLGTAFTKEQAKLLRRFAPEVTLLFDGDAAGKKAVLASRTPLREAQLRARVAVLPEGRDPDDWVREKGPAALRDLATRARGLLEYLMEEALSASFAAADVRERATRVAEVAKLLSEEDDPLVRSMAKAYADQLAGRLDLVRSGADAFGALERTVKRSLATVPSSNAPPVVDRRYARVRPKNPGSAERGAIVGAVLDFPELLHEEGLSEYFALLEGPAALTMACVGRSLRTQDGDSKEKTLDVSVFLAQIPESIHPFASERLAAPQTETLAEAREVVVENGLKLRKFLLERETSQLVSEQRKLGGDWEAETELAKEALQKARLKHGLKQE